MPCSSCGHSYPAPGPPQDDTRVPSCANSRTGGAAFQNERVSLGCSVDGRCVVQMWSRESTATPTPAPTSQWLGSGFGHEGSTVNEGTAGIMEGEPFGRAGPCAPAMM